MANVVSLFCPNCSAPIHHGDLECEYCGAALYAGRAVEITVPALAEAQKIIPEMQERIKRNAYDGDAYYQLGLACFTLRLYVQAEDAFDQARRFSPGDALVHYFSGLSILRRCEPEILSLQEFRINQMKKQFEAALSIDPNLNEAGIYCTFADALLARNREDYAGALAPLNTVVQALPKFAMAWRVLAACRFQVADYEGAVQAGLQALQNKQTQPTSAEDADTAYLVGAAYGRMKQAQEMQFWAKRVATLRGDPGKWESIQREFRGQLE